MKSHATQIMGILNVTPDSFSDGGQFFEKDKAVKRAIQMVKEGADIIDIGGESTRPGSEPLSAEEEIQRVIPVIQEVKHTLRDITISIDTYKSSVAEKALESGATMINSLGGFTFDKKLVSVAAQHQTKVVIYHIKGEPKIMQQGEIYYRDVIDDISEFFEEQIAYAVAQSIKRENIILDPGIGFGKTLEHNLEIIRRLSAFKKFDLPILIGVSRKSHLAKLLQEEFKLLHMPSPRERLEASLAETAIAVLNGATMVRTHDVLETKKFLAVLDKLL